MNRKFERATALLIEYFKMTMESSGLRWDSDNGAEIYEIIQDIFEGMEAVIDDRFDQHMSIYEHNQIGE